MSAPRGPIPPGTPDDYSDRDVDTVRAGVPRGKWITLNEDTGAALFEAITACKVHIAPDPRGVYRRGVAAGLRLLPRGPHGRLNGRTIFWGDEVKIDTDGRVIGIRAEVEP